MTVISASMAMFAHALISSHPVVSNSNSFPLLLDPLNLAPLRRIGEWEHKNYIQTSTDVRGLTIASEDSDNISGMIGEIG